jgi:hypothetical protein
MPELLFELGYLGFFGRVFKFPMSREIACSLI